VLRLASPVIGGGRQHISDTMKQVTKARPPLVGEVVPTFADRGCCVVSATDPPGR
jgi:hypothetical protein